MKGKVQISKSGFQKRMLPYQVVLHQGGLSSVELSSGWSLIRVVFHQLGFHLAFWAVSYQDGLSSVWSVIRVVCHQGGLSSAWSVIRVVCHQGGLSSGWSLSKCEIRGSTVYVFCSVKCDFVVNLYLALKSER